AQPAENVVLLEMGWDAEASFGGKVFDHDRRGGVQRVAAEPRRVGRHQGAHQTIAPPFPGADDQTAVFEPQLQDLTEFDVEAPREELRGGVEEVATRRAGERVLPQTRDRLLLPCRSAQLQLGPGRLLDAEPAKSLGSQTPPLWSGR